MEYIYDLEGGNLHMFIRGVLTTKAGGRWLHKMTVP